MRLRPRIDAARQRLSLLDPARHHLGGQIVGGPARERHVAVGGPLARQADHLSADLRGKSRRSTAARSVLQPREALLVEPLSPLRHDIAPAPQLGGDLVVPQAIGGHQHHLRAHPARRTRCTSTLFRYERADIVLAPGVADAIRAGDGVIVVHGIDYNGNHIYDDVLDRSELNASLPGEATAPALCGPLAKPKASADAHSSGTTLMASLHVFRESAGYQDGPISLLCVLDGLIPPATEPSRRGSPTTT